MRGPAKVYEVSMTLPLTTELNDHVQRIASLADVGRAAVVRALIQDSLDRANEVYTPFPAFAANATNTKEN
jgi:hypothetical protein